VLVAALALSEIRVITRILLVSELVGAALVCLLSVVILVRAGIGRAPAGQKLSWDFLQTNVEFLAFLKQVARAYPRVQLHVVCDNYATHKHPNVQAWLAKHPRVHLHFTPTSGSWLNMVEIFFGIITRQAIRRGTFHSVRDLETAIGIYIDGWNDRAHPFTWTKNADQIISHAKPSPNQKKTYNTRH